MAKDDSINVHTSEFSSDDASDYPITRQYATNSTQPELPSQWQAEPHCLTPEPTTERWLLVFDISLCLIPVGLIAKAILCIVANHLDRNNTGWDIDQVHALTRYLIRFDHQLTTIFTVVFILIITTVVRRLALYMAQEGATVAKLEQLQASISLPGTLKAIWSLRVYTSRTSAVLLLIWGWFYLGSQATASEYGYRTSGNFQHLPMGYFSPEKQSLFYANQSTAKVSGFTISTINAINNVFLMVSGSEPSPSDLHGAALVPYILANGYTSTTGTGEKLSRDRDGYYDVSHSSQINYTSLLGTNLYTQLWYKYDSDVDYTVYVNNLEGKSMYNVTYFNVTCSETSARKASAFPNGTMEGAQVSINMTADGASDPVPHDPPAGFDVWARINDTSSVLHSSCHLELVTAEVKVRCSGGKCGAMKMRLMPTPTPIPRTPFDNSNFTSLFFNNLLLSNGPPLGYSLYDSTSTGSVVNAIMTGFGDLMDKIWTFDSDDSPSLIKSEDDPAMSIAMTVIINTYYSVSLYPLQGTANDGIPNLDVYPYINSILLRELPNKDWSIGTFHGAQHEPQYRLNISWLVVDFVSCNILLAAAVLAMWLRKHTLAPDIFGFVSSLTRDNPHLNLPDGGSTMSGFERARALKHVRVRIGDVADGDGVGRVGLRYAGPATESDIQMVHLKRDRHYV